MVAVHLPIDYLASNWILKKMGANRWIPLLVTTWGIVTTLSGLIQSFGGLVAVRFFLGLCEGGLLPGIVGGCHRQSIIVPNHSTRSYISVPYINVTNFNFGKHKFRGLLPFNVLTINRRVGIFYASGSPHFVSVRWFSNRLTFLSISFTVRCIRRFVLHTRIPYFAS